MRRAPPLIVGGGPAGASAAIALAQAGERPRVLERQREVGDAICGGFLSWRTLGALRRLGVNPRGHMVHKVRLFAGGLTAEARLPAPAVGVSRRALDTQLLARASQLGVTVEHGAQVQQIDDLADQTVFLATGKHDLRGAGRPREEEDPALGLRLRLPPHPRLAALVADAIELHLFDRGYAGLVLQEDGSANLCLAVRKSRLAQAGSPHRLLEQIGEGLLGERLGAGDLSGRIDAIGAVPYGWRAYATEANVYRLGDQAAVIPSLAGEGIGIAVASGVAAARAWSQGQSAEQFQRSFARHTRRPVAAAHLLWRWCERPRLAPFAVRAIDVMPSLAALAARLTRIGGL